MEKGETNFWMIGFVLIFGFFAFLLGTYFPNFLKGTTVPIATISPSVAPTGITIAPTDSTIPSVAPSLSDYELIKAAMAAKYSKPVSEVELTVSKNTGTHAQGGVKFSGEIGGGWFLAYKDVGGWIIVQDGNGTVSCETIAPYNFPTSMVSECVDKNGNLIKK